MFPRLVPVLILNDWYRYKHTQCLLSIKYGHLIQTRSFLSNIQLIAPLHVHCCNKYSIFYVRRFHKQTLQRGRAVPWRPVPASGLKASGLAFWAEVNVLGNFTSYSDVTLY